MTPWQWWAGRDGDVEYEGCWSLGEFATRDAALAAACREFAIGEAFRIIEARSSTSVRHEGAEIVPFLRTRNEETFTVGSDRRPCDLALEEWPEGELEHVPDWLLREHGLTRP